MSEIHCQSCGMPIEIGRYCQYCVDTDGKLHTFEETVVRMSEFIRRQNPKLSEAEARRAVLAHMAKMPAWQDHPRLKTLISL